MANDNKQSYMHTLIFTIISGIFSILLLLALSFKGGRDYLPFIVTLEVGIFIIIIVCIYQIYKRAKLQEIFKQRGIKSIDFNICPDYFTKRADGDRDFCANEYIQTDENMQSKIIKIYPADDVIDGKRVFPSTNNRDIATIVNNGRTSPNCQKCDGFYLDELDREPSLKTPREKCGPLFNPPSGSNLSYLSGYHLLPWTTMKAKCEVA